MIETNLALARDHLAGARHFTPGLSPHAPYTVHPRLLDAVVELARESHAPLAMMGMEISIAEEIRALHELVGMGVITKGEFEAKKTELMGRLDRYVPTETDD